MGINEKARGLGHGRGPMRTRAAFEGVTYVDLGVGQGDAPNGWGVTQECRGSSLQFPGARLHGALNGRPKTLAVLPQQWAKGT